MTWSLTPQQRALEEDAANLQLAGTGRRVCLHVDRTSVRRDGGGYTITCDYCPARAVVVPGGFWCDIPPYLLE